MAIRKSFAILSVVVAMFTVACESEEDTGTGGIEYMGATTFVPYGFRALRQSLLVRASSFSRDLIG